MIKINKGLMVGIMFLVASGLNVYLPDVGNLFDAWRIMFSIVTFMAGWIFVLENIYNR